MAEKGRGGRFVSFLLVGLFVVSLIFTASAVTVIFSDVSINGTLTNVTAENNFTHLALNDSSIFLYFPFDINHSFSNNLTYDYSSNNYDGSVGRGANVFGDLFWQSSNVFAGGAYNIQIKSVNSGNGLNNITVPTLRANDTNLNGSFTVAAWTYYGNLVADAATQQAELIGFGNAFDTVVNSTWCIRLSASGELTFQVKNQTEGSFGGIYNSGVKIAQGVPFHVAVVVNKTGNTNNVSMYRNGTLIANSNILGGVISNNSRPLTIGTCNGGGAGTWNGTIDEVILFNRALGTSEVSALYSNTSVRFRSQGTQVFSNLDLQDTNENFLNISINQTLIVNNSNISIRLGNQSGNTYVYSEEYPLVNGRVTEIPLGNSASNQSVMVIFKSDPSRFFSPNFQGLFLESYSTVALPPALNITLNSPTPSEVISANYALANATLNNETGLTTLEKYYGFFNVNNSLLAWIPMEEGNSTTFYDKSGRGLGLVNSSGVSRNTTSAAFGNSSMQFSTTGAIATFPSGLINSRFVETRELTMSLWLNLNSQPSAIYTLLNCVSGNRGFAWYLANGSTSTLVYNNTMRLSLYNGTNVTHAYSDHFPVNTGSWNHLVAKFYRDQVYFYVNGAPIMGSSYSPNFNLTNCGTSATYIGASPFSPQGKIDDIAIFDKALTDQEISYLYNITGADNRSFSTQLHGFTNGTISISPRAINGAGYTSSNASNSTFIATTSGPYVLNANYSFENITNLTSLSIWVDRGFYPSATSYNMSQVNASAYYRANDGSWVLITNNTYVSTNSSQFGGLYGDSITSQGQTYRWPSYFDPIAHTPFHAEDLLQGLGGTWCYRARANIWQNATNGTSIFLQCGTNDLGNNAPLESVIANYTAIFNDSRQKNLSIYLINMLPRYEPQHITNTSALNSWLYNYYLYNNSDRLIKGFADVYNSSLKNETGTANLSLFLDGIHPNDAGAAVYADIVFRQAYHYKYHDGFYAEFIPSTPSSNTTYDLKWILTTPTSESTSYQWDNVFSIAVASTTNTTNATISTRRIDRSAPVKAVRDINFSSPPYEPQNDSYGEPLPEESFFTSASNSISLALSKAKELVTTPWVYITLTSISAIGLGVWVTRIFMRRRLLAGNL